MNLSSPSTSSTHFGKRIATNLKCDLQSISGDLQDSSLWQLTRNTHPGVGSKHGAPELLTRNNHDMVGNHWKTEIRANIKNISLLTLWIVLLSGIRTLTDGCEYIGEAEVVHSIKGQEMVEKLLFLIITAQESISFVKFPIKKQSEIWLGCSLQCWKKEKMKTRSWKAARQPLWPSSQSDTVSIMKNAANYWCDGGLKSDALRFQMIPCFMDHTYTKYRTRQTFFLKDRREKGTRKLQEVEKHSKQEPLPG